MRKVAVVGLPMMSDSHGPTNRKAHTDLDVPGAWKSGSIGMVGCCAKGILELISGYSSNPEIPLGERQKQTPWSGTCYDSYSRLAGPFPPPWGELKQLGSGI